LLFPVSYSLRPRCTPSPCSSPSTGRGNRENLPSPQRGEETERPYPLSEGERKLEKKSSPFSDGTRDRLQGEERLKKGAEQLMTDGKTK